MSTYEWEFDAAGRPVKSTLSHQGVTLGSNIYAYDGDGNVKSMRVAWTNDGKSTNLNDYSFEWTYIENPSPAAWLSASHFLPEFITMREFFWEPVF